ncbi:MAG: class I SAM-dependent methyltransferase [Proteobacteria bacterium]|nr:class I SAM-dependent methyltransferase [Pseudomonadota bacterium]
MSDTGGEKFDIQEFWGALYGSLYRESDGGLTRDVLFQALNDLEDMFRLRGHMATAEMPLAALRGKLVLEIGSGAGGHSALFAKYGAVMTSVDITNPRVRATQAKFDLMGDHAAGCRAMEADAENLPFADASFDIVYSNGVLHHTRDTERAIAEVHRVLKPKGRAIVMLYCKDSWHYWINMFLCIGILMGKAFRDPNWLGKASEWGGKDAQTVANPYTRCYTAAEMRRLFGAFGRVRMRKGEFYFYLIPKIGRLYRRYQIRKYGTHPGGVLVYGEPWPIQSPLELWLGRFMGFSWFIEAEKPAED